MMDFDTAFYIFSALMPTPFGCVFLYALTTDWRFSRKRTLWLFILILTLALGTDAVIFHLMGISPHTKSIVSIITLSAVFGGYFLLSKYNNGRSLFICLSVVTFVFCLSAVGEVIISNSTILRLLLRFALFLAVFYLIIKYFRHPLSELTQELKGGWYRLSMIPFLLSFLFLVILTPGTLIENKELQLITLCLIFATLIIYVALYHIFSTLKQQFSEQTNYSILKEQMLSLQKQTEMVLNKDEQMNIFRHDVRHYIGLLKTCLSRMDFTAAEEILASMNSNLTSMDSSVQHFTGNILVDAILSEYARNADKHDIKFEIQISLIKELEEDPADFAIVIANGLENAFSICRDITDHEHRRIRLIGREQNRTYLFAIENTYDGTILFQGRQHIPVSDQCGHGYGTRSIVTFAEKHNAFLDFGTENNWFFLRMMFSI